jgi:hypothetical protein
MALRWPTVDPRKPKGSNRLWRSLKRRRSRRDARPEARSPQRRSGGREALDRLPFALARFDVVRCALEIRPHKPDEFSLQARSGLRRRTFFEQGLRRPDQGAERDRGDHVGIARARTAPPHSSATALSAFDSSGWLAGALHGVNICEIVCAPKHDNLAHRADDALIDELAGGGGRYETFVLRRLRGS